MLLVINYQRTCVKLKPINLRETTATRSRFWARNPRIIETYFINQQLYFLLTTVTVAVSNQFILIICVNTPDSVVNN